MIYLGRLRLAGGALAVAADAQRRARRRRPGRLALPAAAAAAGAVRGDRAGAPGRRLPRRQRDDPAQARGARARRRASDAARAIGAANTLTFEDGAIVADNTDAPGLLAALPEPPAGRTALVLGAGGAGRAAAWALTTAGAADVAIWNRTPERARALAAELGARAVERRRGGRNRGQLHVRRASRPGRHVQGASRRRPMTWVPEAWWSTWSTGPEGRNSSKQQEPGGPAWSTVWRSLSLRVLRRSSAGPAWRPPVRRCGRPPPPSPIHESANTDRGTKTSAKRKGNGVTSPSRRGGSGRVLTDVIVDLGFVDQGRWTRRSSAPTTAARCPSGCWSPTARLTEDQLARAVAERFGLDHIDLRLYRVDPDAAKLVTPAAVTALPGRAGLVPRRADAAGRDGRSRERARAGRHRGHDRLRDPPGGGVADRTSTPCSSGSRTPTSATAPPRRSRTRTTRGGRRGRRSHRRPAGPMYDLRDQTPINFGAVGRGRVGHPARAPGHQGGRRTRLLRHPLRARRRGDARPLPHRRRAAGGRRDPGQRRARRRLAHEDPRRPGHRRAPRAAGRPHLARGRGQADRPARRDAARAPTARTSSCASSTRARS